MRAPAVAAVLALAALYVGAAIDWAMPGPTSPARDNLILDGRWAYQGVDLQDEAGCVYPPLGYLAMEAAFVPLRRAVGPDADPDRVAPAFVVAGRAVSGVLALVASAAVFAIGRRAGGPAAGAIAAVLFLLSPAVVYYSRTTNAEVPYLAWFALSIAVALRLEAGETRFLGEETIFWLLAAAAIATKDQAAMLFPLVVPVLFRRLPGASRARFAAGAAVAAVAYYAAYLPFGGWSRLERHVRAMRDVSAIFATHDRSLSSQLDLAAGVAGDLWDAAGPVLVVLGAIGLVVLARTRGRDPRRFAVLRAFALTLIPYVLAIFFLARRSYARYLIVAVPALAVGAGVVLASWWQAAGRSRLVLRTSVATVLAVAIAGGGTVLAWLAGDPPGRARAYLVEAVERGEVEPDSRIGLFSILPGIVFERDDQGVERIRPFYRDWSEVHLGRVDPRLPLLPLLPRADALYLSRPTILAVRTGADRIDAPWFEPLADGRLGYRRLAVFEQPRALDLSHFLDRRDLVLLTRDDEASAGWDRLRRFASDDAAAAPAGDEAILFLPPEFQEDPAVQARQREVLAGR